MIKLIFKVFKKVVLAAILIYSFNVFAVSLNLLIPINIFTIFFVTLFDIPALVCLILFSMTF